MKTIALVPLLVAVLLAALLIVGSLREADPITAVNPVFCPTTEPVPTATPDGGPTYTPTLTHTPCFIKLTSTPTVTPTPTPTPGGPAMSLRVEASQQTICPGEPQTGTVCVIQSRKFDVVVVADAIPAAGYTLTQVWLDYDSQGLTAKPVVDPSHPPDGACATGMADPCFIWPDCNEKTFLASQHAANNGAYAGCFTQLFPPMTASYDTGDLYSFSLTCTSDQSSSDLRLPPKGDPVAGTSGAVFWEYSTGIGIVPAVTGITVNCVPEPTKQDKPGDTDGDGCADAHESGPDETQGGQRNFLDPNDYYDVYGPNSSLTLDGVIDLPNDILGVMQHFSPAGAPPYDVRFDRGPQIGANHWERDAPDGVIDLPNDILGVIQQFGHNCA